MCLNQLKYDFWFCAFLPLISKVIFVCTIKLKVLMPRNLTMLFLLFFYINRMFFDIKSSSDAWLNYSLWMRDQKIMVVGAKSHIPNQWSFVLSSWQYVIEHCHEAKSSLCLNSGNEVNTSHHFFMQSLHTTFKIIFWMEWELLKKRIL